MLDNINFNFELRSFNCSSSNHSQSNEQPNLLIVDSKHQQLDLPCRDDIGLPYGNLSNIKRLLLSHAIPLVSLFQVDEQIKSHHIDNRSKFVKQKELCQVLSHGLDISSHSLSPSIVSHPKPW